MSELLGGQAVVEGVMMRSPDYYSVAVRKPNGKMAVKTEKINLLSKRFPILGLPFFRGSVNLYEALSIGMKALIFSAEEASEEEEKISKKELTITFIIAIVFAIALFVLLPLFLASLVPTENSIIFNLIDGIVRFAVFIAYLLIISSFKDVKRIFSYHGAEHMVVHAQEHKKKLTAANAMKFSTAHPRCGTSFLLIVLIISIIVFSFVTYPNFFVKFLSRLVLIPVIAGISYELLRLSSKISDSFVGRLLVYPGLAIQKITTKQPDKRQIEVAIAAMKATLRASRH